MKIISQEKLRIDKYLMNELELFEDSTSANFALVQKKVIEKLLEMYYALI